MNQKTDFQKLKDVHEQRAHIAAMYLAQSAALIDHCRNSIDSLGAQVTAAKGKYEQDVIRHLSAARTAAHLEALPSVITLLKHRLHDFLRLVEHQMRLAMEELQEAEAAHAVHQKAVYAANAKVEKFTSLIERTKRQETLRAEDAADELAADEQPMQEKLHAS
jgi:hypothetical protein